MIAESGEDEIAFCDDENFAANVETLESGNAPNGGELTYARGIEVGHIFQLGDKYSEAMKLEYWTLMEKTSIHIWVVMGLLSREL